MAVMSHLQQQMNPRTVEFDYLNEIFKILKQVSLNKALEAEFYQHFVCEFRLWIYHDAAHQLLLIRSICELVMSETLPNMDDHGLYYFLNILEEFYWYKPSDTTTPNTRTLTEGPFAITVSRPPQEKMKELRQHILSFISSHVFRRVTPSHIRRLLFSLISSRDVLHVAEVFDCIFEYILENPDGGFFDSLVFNSVPEVFFELLNYKLEHLRLGAMNAIVFLLQSPKVTEKYKKRVCPLLSLHNTPPTHSQLLAASIRRRGLLWRVPDVAAFSVQPPCVLLPPPARFGQVFLL